MRGEGWGMAGMIGLIALSIVGLIIDLVLMKLIKNNWILNLTELLIVALISLELWILLN